MDLPIIEAFDRHRPFENKPFRSVCYAPFSSLDFDPAGLVRACGVTRDYVLGDLREESLDEIWNGFRASQLRDAVKSYDMGSGCHSCENSINDGEHSADHFPGRPLHAKHYDSIPVAADEEFRPSHFTFRLGKVKGNFSVASRKQLPEPTRSSPYGNQFFEDLRRYVPQIQSAHFLGSEPFLVDEHFRLWELMVELGHVKECQILTEGATCNKRVEWVLQRLPCTITMSLEGISKEMIERTRPGSDLDLFMENFCRFQEYSVAAGRFIYFDFILSRVNWKELPEILRFAERHCCLVNVRFNHPSAVFRIDTMSVDELEQVVEVLSRRDGIMQAKLSRNKSAWIETLESLRQYLAVMKSRQNTTTSAPKPSEAEVAR